jgi:type IV secretory pathway protease TraF
VPLGIYRAADPVYATYISFCVTPSQAKRISQLTSTQFCTTEESRLPQMIKKIAAINKYNHYTVKGQTALAIDSRYLGPIEQTQIIGFWKPLWVWPPDRKAGTHKSRYVNYVSITDPDNTVIEFQ